MITLIRPTRIQRRHSRATFKPTAAFAILFGTLRWAACAQTLDSKPELRIHGMQLVQTSANAPLKGFSTGSERGNRPYQASVFEFFTPKVGVRWDERFLYVESSGLPAHPMMAGITNWQQHVPIPQRYTGSNAWRIPLFPVPASTPTSIKGRFLRGAIALAANGVPIFNPQNNRGEVAAEIGELDKWGGHCGRADDYHYHAAPLHLQNTVGPGNPIAFALDGYPIYGLNEPDGSKPTDLDTFNGHSAARIGYHYHASTQYPYVNGGFHGEVIERDGQVDPQPSGQPIRGALPPLRGATITSLEASAKDVSVLTYQLNGEKHTITYKPNVEGGYDFEFNDGKGASTQQTFSRGRGGGEPSRPEGPPPNPRPQDPNRPPPRPEQPPALQSGPQALAPIPSPLPTSAQNSSGFVLRSPAVTNGGTLPVEYTGDGAGSTLPLEWSGAPAGTKTFALLMHHLDPEGITKWYWILYNLPASVMSLPKNVKGQGVLGSNFQGRAGYQPPHSKGPGAKTYVLTLYALSSALDIRGPAESVSYNTMLSAMQGKVLASTDLSVVYNRTGAVNEPRPGPPPRDRAKPNN